MEVVHHLSLAILIFTAIEPSWYSNKYQVNKLFHCRQEYPLITFSELNKRFYSGSCGNKNLMND